MSSVIKFRSFLLKRTSSEMICPNKLNMGFNRSFNSFDVDLLISSLMGQGCPIPSISSYNETFVEWIARRHVLYASRYFI